MPPEITIISGVQPRVPVVVFYDDDSDCDLPSLAAQYCLCTEQYAKEEHSQDFRKIGMIRLGWKYLHYILWRVRSPYLLGSNSLPNNILIKLFFTNTKHCDVSATTVVPSSGGQNVQEENFTGSAILNFSEVG